MKPGWQTTEFGITVVTIATSIWAGFAHLLPATTQAVVVAVASSAYAIARAVTKAASAMAAARAVGPAATPKTVENLHLGG